MKTQDCWKDLNAQSSQATIEELSGAFQSWFDVRQTDETANPPGYRKHGDARPRATVTFKEDGFKHDSEHNRVRLSKGTNLTGRPTGEQELVETGWIPTRPTEPACPPT
jgi:hypothetical protein